MAAVWSELNDDILGLILEKLPLPDHVRFGSVCVSWNLVVKSRIHRSRAQAPWLMIPNDDDEKSARFFSLSENRTYDIRVPEPPIRRRLWIGCSYGWLITVDEDCEMHLLDPIAGVQILLPSITTLPFVDAIRDPQDGHILKFKWTYPVVEFTPDDFRCFFFIKAVLSSPPTSRDGTGDFVVMLIHNPDETLAFMRAGDKAWTPLRTPITFKDIIFRGGSFYTLSWQYKIHAWDVKESGGFTDIRCHVDPHKSNGFSFKPRFVANGKFTDACSSYLAVTRYGELVIIHRDYMEGSIEYLIRKKNTTKWSPVVDTNDSVLFIGNNPLMFISATNLPELRRNSIYFTDSNLEYSKHHRQHARDIGIYDLTDRCFKPLDCLPSHLTWPPPIWFSPVLR